MDMRELFTPFQEVVIVNRLNLQVIVEARNIKQRLVTLSVDDRADELTSLTGRADENILAVLRNDLLRQTRLAMVVFEMRKRYHLIEIAKTIRILR